MAGPSSASQSAPRAVRFPRLRAAGRAVRGQWAVIAFGTCYQYLHPGRPVATAGAVLLFAWLAHVIETWRITITLGHHTDPPAIPPCRTCPRAAGAWARRAATRA